MQPREHPRGYGTGWGQRIRSQKNVRRTPNDTIMRSSMAMGLPPGGGWSHGCSWPEVIYASPRNPPPPPRSKSPTHAIRRRYANNVERLRIAPDIVCYVGEYVEKESARRVRGKCIKKRTRENMLYTPLYKRVTSDSKNSRVLFFQVGSGARRHENGARQGKSGKFGRMQKIGLISGRVDEWSLKIGRY